MWKYAAGALEYFNGYFLLIPVPVIILFSRFPFQGGWNGIFCFWIKKQTHSPSISAHGWPLLTLGYRLPTNEEWEYAARGGNQSKGYAFSGSDDVMEVAHFGAGVPCKVGMYKPNELGIYDMTGNVNEYVHRVDEKGMRAGSQGGGFKLEGPVNQLVIYNRHGWGDEVAGFRLVLVGEKPKNAKQGFLSNDWKTYRLRGKVKSCKLHLEVEFDERGRLIRDNEICVEYAGDDNNT